MAEDVGERALRVAGAVRWGLIALLSLAAAAAWLRFDNTGAQVAQAADRYQCPMHPAFVRDGPGNCAICGMQLVRAGREEGLVAIDAERTQLVGMRTAPAIRERLALQVRTTGFVAADESAVALATTRFSGWVDELRAQAGEHVEKGEVLAMVSGPELLTAQQVFLAGRGWAARQNLPPEKPEQENNALQRLGIAQRDIDTVARRGRPLPALPIRAPISGHVARRSVLPGLYVQPGAELFQIVDLSRVWLLVDVHEQDMRRVEIGQVVRFVADGAGETFAGRVDFVYPALEPGSRTLRARVPLANPDLHLRPGMSGAAILEAEAPETLTIPTDAVVDTGETQYVLVARGDGHFDPRTVRLGARAEGRVQVLEGLEEGEPVVTTANFVIDSESRIRGALEAFRPRTNAAARADTGRQP